VTINDLIEEGGRRRPYEIFINTKNLQHFSWIVAMTRLISSVFRHEPAPLFLVDELKSIYDPNGGYFSEGSFVPSLAADIGRVIEKHLYKIGLKGDKKKKVVPSNEQKQNTASSSSMMFCPQCNEKSLISQENCLKCLGCGYSKCS
jgi:ribonucleoside-diphosphate reductase alpha chain